MFFLYIYLNITVIFLSEATLSISCRQAVETMNSHLQIQENAAVANVGRFRFRLHRSSCDRGNWPLSRPRSGSQQRMTSRPESLRVTDVHNSLTKSNLWCGAVISGMY